MQILRFQHRYIQFQLNWNKIAPLDLSSLSIHEDFGKIITITNKNAKTKLFSKINPNNWFKVHFQLENTHLKIRSFCFLNSKIWLRGDGGIHKLFFFSSVFDLFFRFRHSKHNIYFIEIDQIQSNGILFPWNCFRFLNNLKYINITHFKHFSSREILVCDKLSFSH